ncbi:MAG: Hpt domain-containing protein [Lachnospiraceae bacterium]
MQMEGKEEYRYINIEKGKAMFDDNMEVYAEIADVFCQNAPRQIENIVKSIEKEDYVTYDREVHTLKSLAGNLGAEALSAMAVRHDAAYRKKDYLFLKKSYWDVVSLYSEVVRELKKICKNGVE